MERLPAGRGTACGGHIPTCASASLVVLDVAVACPPKGKVWVCSGGHGPRDSQPRCSLQGRFRPLLLFFRQTYAPCGCSLQRMGKDSWARPGSARWGVRPQQTLGRMPRSQGSAPGAVPQKHWPLPSALSRPELCSDSLSGKEEGIWFCAACVDFKEKILLKWLEKGFPCVLRIRRR